MQMCKHVWEIGNKKEELCLVIVNYFLTFFLAHCEVKRKVHVDQVPLQWLVYHSIVKISFKEKKNGSFLLFMIDSDVSRTGAYQAHNVSRFWYKEKMSREDGKRK